MLKKIDKYVLKNFLTLFVGTFVISIFILMMQFLWKYIDDLVGKGLEMDVLAKFFFYAGETLVSLALPLAILLASLISFGNMGERLELLAMKAAGIPLVRIMRPIAVFMVVMTGVSYYFQDYAAPYAQKMLFQMLYSVRQTSPTIDIPEGVFYDGIDGVNLYVKEKDPKTDMLYEVIIYELSEGAANAHIILADSAMLETSADKEHLLLHLFSGEQFENLRTNAMATNNVPYRRETFVDKHFIIDFSTDFSMTDNDFSQNAKTKSMGSLLEGVDSLQEYVDSTALAYYDDMKRGTLMVSGFTKAQLNFIHRRNRMVERQHLVMNGHRPDTGRQMLRPDTVASDTTASAISALEQTSEQIRRFFTRSKERQQEDSLYAATQAEASKVLAERAKLSRVDADSLFQTMKENRQSQVVHNALQKVSLAASDMEFRAEMMKAIQRDLRMHKIQFWQKITLALSCLVFFFIGAPLGAIIRQGGMGMPVVVAVIIFIFYYIINSFGSNLAHAGTIPVWLGMWFSTLVLAPIAYYLTIKSNNDSVVFNIDTYRNFFRKVFGIKTKRSIFRKEVIIRDPQYGLMHDELLDIADKAQAYRRTKHLNRFPNYIKLFFGSTHDDEVAAISQKLEHCVEELSNSKDRYVLNHLNVFPILDADAHTAPFKSPKWNKAVGYFFPAGVFFLFRVSRFRRRLSRELKVVMNTAKSIAKRCEELEGDQPSVATSTWQTAQDDGRENAKKE
ncbi:MAG: LptF/LptG family permease [Bacteroidaceae bacterium]|nr:LptF/LptG family permease [Bacteroidaceae bacterium]